MIAIETSSSAGEIWRLIWNNVNLNSKTITIIGCKGHRTLTYPISDELLALFIRMPKKRERIFWNVKDSEHFNDAIRYVRSQLAKETGNQDFLKIHFHTFRHYAISWKYFKCKDPVETQRFARHCNLANTEKYIHIVKSWIKSNEYDVIYAESKEELTKYLSEGY